MSFKPAKPRTEVLKKGRMSDKYHFSLGVVQISSVSEKPVKNLGKIFNCILRHCSGPVNLYSAESMAISNGQVRTSMEVQGMDLHENGEKLKFTL